MKYKSNPSAPASVLQTTLNLWQQLQTNIAQHTLPFTNLIVLLSRRTTNVAQEFPYNG
jgi:hypothetical protein